VGGRLEGLVALVNGAGRGLGKASAIGLAREGARVVVNDLGTGPRGDGSDPSRAESVAAEIRAQGGEAIADAGDITRLEDAERSVATAIETYGKLDILVNCAGIIRLGTVVDTSPEDFDDVIRVHLRGYFNTTCFAARHWVARKEYGRLINFASGASLISQPTLLAYSTAKALVAYNVTANCIRPTAATAMSDLARRVPGDDRPPASEVASGTLRDPSHVVPLVVFLASPMAGHVSGRLLEGQGSRYVLWSEPTAERVLEKNFLDDPEAVYSGLADELAAGLSLKDLKMPMAPFSQIGNWADKYGFMVPNWDFTTNP
jgi:NAD(P)-dependent dehydrogenase (short-subunit alcohol dehydrogenase family)